MMMMSLYNDMSCNTIVDRKDHVQYLTVSKSYSDDFTCSSTEQSITIDYLCYGAMILCILCTISII